MRFQYSVRTLAILIALAALLLAPLAWLAREQRRILAAREAAIRAVVLAERAAMVRARDELRPIQFRSLDSDQYAAAHTTRPSALDAAEHSPATGKSDSALDAPATSSRLQTAPAVDLNTERIKQLVRENAELKGIVKRLQREVEQLKASAGP
jgi:hypothetical protein